MILKMYFHESGHINLMDIGDHIIHSFIVTNSMLNRRRDIRKKTVSPRTGCVIYFVRITFHRLTCEIFAEKTWERFATCEGMSKTTFGLSHFIVLKLMCNAMVTIQV